MADRFFPTVHEIAQRAIQERARPDQWRETNLRMLAEFVEVTGAAGLSPPRATESADSSAHGWLIGGRDPGLLLSTASRHDFIYLVTDPPPRWLVSDWRPATEAYGDHGRFDDTIGLADLPDLVAWDPSALQAALRRYLPS
jgi:hypothetical protein